MTTILQMGQGLLEATFYFNIFFFLSFCRCLGQHAWNVGDQPILRIPPAPFLDRFHGEISSLGQTPRPKRPHSSSRRAGSGEKEGVPRRYATSICRKFCLHNVVSHTRRRNRGASLAKQTFPNHSAKTKAKRRRKNKKKKRGAAKPGEADVKVFFSPRLRSIAESKLGNAVFQCYSGNLSSKQRANMAKGCLPFEQTRSTQMTLGAGPPACTTTSAMRGGQRMDWRRRAIRGKGGQESKFGHA